MRCLLIKKNFNEEKQILDIIKSFLGSSIKVVDDDNFITIYHSYENVNEINGLLFALESEFLFNLLAYNTNDSDGDRLEDEIKIAKSLLSNLAFNVYDLKSALISSKNIENKREILNFILESSGINEKFIIDFAECDLNVSKASKVMFVHRNTMIYKLDKLNELSGFDLRVFKDAYILYSLIQR